MTHKQLTDLFNAFTKEKMLARYPNASKRAETARIMSHIEDYIREQGMTDPSAVTEYLTQSRGDKRQARAIILAFFAYYEERTGEVVSHDLNTVHPVDIPLIRQLEILKYLHEPATTKEIAERFGTSEETIRNDLTSLRDGLQLYGSTLRAEPVSVGKAQVKSYRSTVHPFFLTLNLTEVSAMTTLLGRLAHREGLEDVYLPIISKIYHQLSPYARAKIDSQDAALGQTLPDPSESFRDEARWVMGTDSIKSKLMYALKAGAAFDLYVATDMTSQWLKGCRLNKMPMGDIITVEYEGKEKQLKLSDITMLVIEKYI